MKKNIFKVLYVIFILVMCVTIFKTSKTNETGKYAPIEINNEKTVVKEQIIPSKKVKSDVDYLQELISMEYMLHKCGVFEVSYISDFREKRVFGDDFVYAKDEDGSFECAYDKKIIKGEESESGNIYYALLNIDSKDYKTSYYALWDNFLNWDDSRYVEKKEKFGSKTSYIVKSKSNDSIEYTYLVNDFSNILESACIYVGEKLIFSATFRNIEDNIPMDVLRIYNEVYNNPSSNNITIVLEGNEDKPYEFKIGYNTLPQFIINDAYDKTVYIDSLYINKLVNSDLLIEDVTYYLKRV